MSLTLRGIKQSALTHGELDNNFLWLKSRDIVDANLAGNNLVLTKDDTTTFNVDLSTISSLFTGNTSASCITDLYVTNVHGCSPITIHDSVQSIGSQATGVTSFAFGGNVSSFGNYSHAEGSNTQSIGIFSHSEGDTTISSGDSSHSEGFFTQSIGYASHAEGLSNQSIGDYSHAEGMYNISVGVGSHVEGRGNVSYGDRNSVGGNLSVAGAKLNYFKNVGGIYYNATTKQMNVMGDLTSNYSDGSTIYWGHSDNLATYKSVVSGSVVFVSGTTTVPNTRLTYPGYSIITIYDDPTGGVNDTWAYEYGYVAVPDNTVSDYDKSNSLVFAQSSVAEKNNSLVFGYYNTSRNGGFAHGQYSIAEGLRSHAEGWLNIALGEQSHAEGFFTDSIGDRSHSEGVGTDSTGSYSHSEGGNTNSIGYASHAEGWFTTSKGQASHTEGFYTIADGNYQSVLGQYNVTGNTVQSAVIIGNGTSDLNRSNLLFAAGNEVNISGKTITTNFQMTSGSTTDYILTSSDSQGNGKWTPSYNLSSKDYGSFYDTTTQTGGNGTIQSFQLNASGATKGVSITDLTGITITHTGVYNIQFSAQLKNDGGSKHTVFIWLMKNGLDIPNTNTGIELGNNNTNFVAAWNFVEEFNSNDVINLMWYSPSTDVSILYDATPTAGPEIPSLILTITQI